MKRISKYLRFRTSFPSIEEPALDDSDPPDLADASSVTSSSSSTDSSLVSIKQDEYNSKIDEDVKVFMDISSRLSLDSLLFLLQNHAKAQLEIPNDAYAHYCNSSKKNSELTAADNVRAGLKATAKLKKLRFADVLGGQKVRTVVHEFSTEYYDDSQDDSRDENSDDRTYKSSLWWTAEQMHTMKLRARRTVRLYKKQRPELAESIVLLSSPDIPPFQVESQIKKVTSCRGDEYYSFARGLEIHIVPILRRAHHAAIRAVLEEQDALRRDEVGHDYADMCERLRGRSVECTRQSATLAARLAHCDRIDALGASLSRWRHTPVATSEFF